MNTTITLKNEQPEKSKKKYSVLVYELHAQQYFVKAISLEDAKKAYLAGEAVLGSQPADFIRSLGKEDGYEPCYDLDEPDEELSFLTLSQHAGHRISLGVYGPESYEGVAVACDDCSVVILQRGRED